MMAVCVRVVIVGAGVGDALAVAALGGLYAFTLFLESKKEAPVNESIKKELSDVKAALAALRVGKTIGR